MKSPLRYPGGKTRGLKEIIKYFPVKLNRLCSPFLGGGSVELELASRGVTVFGYDIFKPLVTFWQILLKDAKGLSEIVKGYYPLTRRKFYALQKSFSSIKYEKQQAAIFFALNRASFSGTTFSGGMSRNHPRFTLKSICFLRDFKVNNFHVRQADFRVSLAKHKKDFLYLDPPYLKDVKLYGQKGDGHVGFDHAGLARILMKRKRWILSYNDCPDVRKLYKGFRIKTPHWTYGMGKDKKSNELLILSRDL